MSALYDESPYQVLVRTGRVPAFPDVSFVGRLAPHLYLTVSSRLLALRVVLLWLFKFQLNSLLGFGESVQHACCRSCRLVDLQHPLTSSGVKTCSSPVSYSPGQGTYYFQTVVADQAGNAAAYNATILSSGALSSISQLSWYLAVGLGASVWMLL